MGRILAIDYGKKRCGVAVTDPDRIIANSLDTVDTHKLLEYLTKYMAGQQVDEIIMGKATRFSGEESEIMPLARGFAKQLENKFSPLHVIWVDERFTSKLAFQTMIDGGLKKSDRANKGLIDKISATILLQSYLEQIRNSK